jgi:hypothetical protein
MKKEARLMLFLAPDFWPWFWAILAAGAALTIVISAVVATVSLPRIGSRHLPHTPATPHPAVGKPSPSHAGQLRKAA